jgi:hypothetical protein
MATAWADSVTPAEDVGDEQEIEPLLVDEKRAAKMLGISRRKVFELNESGDLKCRRIGSRKLYSVKQLREYAEGPRGECE